MMTLKEAALEAVQFFTEHPERHTIAQYAMNTAGLPCNPTDPEATCFCFFGRVAHNLDGDINRPLDPLRGALEIAADHRDIIQINDGPLPLANKLVIFARAAALLPDGE